MSNSSRYAVGLDAGSQRTRCVICVLEEGRIRLLGFGEAASRGWGKARLSDQAAAAESIREAVEAAEAAARISIDAAVVGVGGSMVESANSRGLYEFGRPREIDAGDLGLGSGGRRASGGVRRLLAHLRHRPGHPDHARHLGRPERVDVHHASLGRGGLGRALRLRAE